MKNALLKKYIILGMLTALEIILSRFLSIATPIVKIGFAFIPLSVMAMFYGPWWACLAGGLADLIGALLFPTGAYFPGFTLTAALTGMTYGLLLYKRPKSWLRISIAVLFISIVLNLCLDTVWLTILLDKGMIALLPTRIIKCVIMAPVQIVVIKYVWAALRNVKFISNVVGSDVVRDN